MITTAFTRRFGLRHPLVQAGMASDAGVALVAAVSNAGALGTMGSIGRSPDGVREEAARCREATRAPWAINVVCFPWGAPWADVAEAALAAHPPLLTFSFGDPLPWLERARALGIPAFVQVQDLSGAKAALAAGADALIVQGNEAGGHTGRRGTLSFAAQVLRLAGETPVAVAGGIADGRGLAAVLAMGAGAAVMGTRFKATFEFGPMVVHDGAQKAAIVASDGGDTVYDEINDIALGRAWPHRVTGRTLRNRFHETWLGRQEELRAEVAATGSPAWTIAHNREPDTTLNWAGESAGLIDAIEPAATVVERVVEEAEALLRRVATLLGE